MNQIILKLTSFYAMDPSQYNHQSYLNLLQNQQPHILGDTSQNPQYSFYPPTSTTNSNMWHRPPIGSSIGVESCNYVPQFSTQIGREPQLSTSIDLEHITLDEGPSSNKAKKQIRASFSMEEDTLLLQTWLNISKDPVVGVDQKAEGFWLRIKDNYNTYRNQLPKRELGQLTSRYHQLNTCVSKFVGC
jgi:hypothetical protein